MVIREGSKGGSHQRRGIDGGHQGRGRDGGHRGRGEHGVPQGRGRRWWTSGEESKVVVIRRGEKDKAVARGHEVMPSIDFKSSTGKDYFGLK